MTFAYTPYVVPLAVASLFMFVLALIALGRRRAAGVMPFAVLGFGVAVWSAFGALEHAAVEAESKLLMSSLSYLGITVAPGAWLAFALDYTGQGRWLIRRNVALLTIEPILTVYLSVANPGFLFRSPAVLDTSGMYPALNSTFGPLFWVHAAYSYALMLGGTALLIRAFAKSPELYRGQIVGLLVGAVTPWLANAIYIFGFSPFPNLDLTPFAFLVTGLSMGWSIYRYRLLDIVPIARDRVIDEMDDALIVLDARNRVVDINRAALKLLGAPPRGEAIGKPVAELMADRPDLVSEYRDTPSARAELDVEVEGQRRVFDLRLSPLRDAQGELAGRVALLADITDSKESARQIKEQNEALIAANRALDAARVKADDANQIKSEFLANMSHELRTPLNSVIGYADLLLETIGDNLSSKQANYVQRILSNGQRLLTMINELLDLSKIEAGRFELASMPLSPVDLLLRIEDQMRPLVGAKGLRYLTQIDSDMLSLKVMGDSGRLEQVFVNLIGNAIKFTDEGSVRVEICPVKPDRWKVSVADTGIGIPPEARDLIFEAFRQVDGSSQRMHEGAGLGLAITQRMVKMMGGTIQVTSEVGAGSVFTVVLPLTIPAVSPQAEATAP